MGRFVKDGRQIPQPSPIIDLFRQKETIEIEAKMNLSSAGNRENRRLVVVIAVEDLAGQFAARDLPAAWLPPLFGEGDFEIKPRRHRHPDGKNPKEKKTRLHAGIISKSVGPHSTHE